MQLQCARASENEAYLKMKSRTTRWTSNRLKTQVKSSVHSGQAER